MQVVRILAAVIGGALVVATASTVLRTLVIPRARDDGMSRAIDRCVDAMFRLLARRSRSYDDRDHLLAGQAAIVLVATLSCWLAQFLIGYALLLWPWVHHVGGALRESASSLLTLGFDATRGDGPTSVDVLTAITGLVVVAVQIAYLPTLYSAFNRRETEVTLLGARAGSPPWGPELLARTRYGMHPTYDDLPGYYLSWERWAADVAESHANYPVLIRFRSPQPLSSWLVGLLAVMDSAALLLALCPSRETIEPRRCLRMGFTALRQIGTAIGAAVDWDPDPDAPLLLGYDDYVAGVQRLVDVGFPVERSAEEAWPHFRGWRVNYEAIAYELARRTDAVPALWSGPRRWASEPMPPARPPNRLPTVSAAGEPDEAGQKGSAG